MNRCRAGFDWKLEIFKYSIQAVYLFVALIFHFRVLRSLYTKWRVYAKIPFYRLYHIDSILSVLLIFLNIGVIRVINFIPQICPLLLPYFPEPSQWISLLFIDHYLKFSKCLIFCFMMVNRASVGLCPMSHNSIHRCLTTHAVVFSLIAPALGVWPVFLSESQFVPFQGGFIHEAKRNYQWTSLDQFSSIIATITLFTIAICSILCLCCMCRYQSETKHTEHSLTASALFMSVFYVIVLSMDIFFHLSRPSTKEMAEFWKALVDFSFDILLICPPVIMLCLNVRLRANVFYENRKMVTTPCSAK